MVKPVVNCFQIEFRIFALTTDPHQTPLLLGFSGVIRNENLRFSKRDIRVIRKVLIAVKVIERVLVYDRNRLPSCQIACQLW